MSRGGLQLLIIGTKIRSFRKIPVQINTKRTIHLLAHKGSLCIVQGIFKTMLKVTTHSFDVAL